MSESITDPSDGRKTLNTALILGGIFMVVSVIVCGAVAVIFIYNAPW